MEGIVGGAGPAGDAGLPGQPLGQLQMCPEDVVSEFDCPICYEYLCPPIFQCRAGHLVCSSCRPKISRCPSCRSHLGEIRSLTLERVASNFGFRCKYSGDGCGSVVLYTERTSHEDACEYRPYCCPYPRSGCKWQGPLYQVKPHLRITYKCEITASDAEEDVEFWSVRLDVNMVCATMTSWFGRDFLFVLKKRKINGIDKYFAFAQLIGSHTDAEEFSYRLELGDPEDRQLTWTGRTSSIRDEGNTVILRGDCLSFDKNTARLFYADEEQELLFCAKIWKVREL